MGFQIFTNAIRVMVMGVRLTTCIVAKLTSGTINLQLHVISTKQSSTLKEVEK